MYSRPQTSCLPLFRLIPSPHAQKFYILKQRSNHFVFALLKSPGGFSLPTLKGGTQALLQWGLSSSDQSYGRLAPFKQMPLRHTSHSAPKCTCHFGCWAAPPILSPFGEHLLCLPHAVQMPHPLWNVWDPSEAESLIHCPVIHRAQHPALPQHGLQCIVITCVPSASFLRGPSQREKTGSYCWHFVSTWHLVGTYLINL